MSILPPPKYRTVTGMGAWLQERATNSEGGYLLVISVFVGLAMGFIAVGFRLLLMLSHGFFMGSERAPLRYRDFGNHPAETAVQAVLPALGGLAVGLLVYKLLRLRGGHGVPSVMKAVATGQVNLHPSMAIKSATSPITIASGGSSGPEGPIVEIGAVAGSIIGSFAKVRKDQIGTLVGCGAAAGIAAIFGAPMGGVLFSLELIMRDFNVRKFSPIVVAAVVASVTSTALLPNDPAYTRLGEHLLGTIQPSGFLILQFTILGLLCAAVGALMVTALYSLYDFFQWLRIPMWLKPALGGLAVGLIGLGAPSILGEGYESVNQLVLDAGARPDSTGMMILVLGVLCVLKILVTSLTLGSGGTGGTFAPAMVAGAFAGGALGLVMEQLMPTTAPDFRVFAMVGMGGVICSALGTPLAALLIVYEIAGGHYQLALPLLVTVAISALMGARIRKGSVYTLSLLRDGFDVDEEERRRRDPLQKVFLKDIMTTSFVPLLPSDGLPRVLELLGETDADAFPLVDAKGNLLGVISTNDLRSVINLGELGDAVFIAQDIAEPNPPSLYPDSPVTKALDIFGASEIEGIPVLEGRGSRRVAGMIYRGAVLRAYRQAASARP
ncbi:chloride channel protein [Candidatus Poribacteria bacterium]|nr:chloride channel protein [Candidatus Poribacteria bacterium]